MLHVRLIVPAELRGTVTTRLEGDATVCHLTVLAHQARLNGSEVLSDADLFLFDVKHADGAGHRKLTGQGNELILENLRRLSERKARIEIRMPLVPGCNDSPENIRRTGELLGSLSVEKVRLLRYNPLARSKYAIAPVDLIRQIGPVTLTERHRREAARDLTRILGPTRPPGAADHRRPPSAVLDRWFLDRYLRTVGELLRDLGHRRRPEREGEP